MTPSRTLFSMAIWMIICTASLPIVPSSVTIWEGVARHNRRRFLVVGASVLLPVILGYTFDAYWAFHGTVAMDCGCH